MLIITPTGVYGYNSIISNSLFWCPSSSLPADVSNMFDILMEKLNKDGLMDNKIAVECQVEGSELKVYMGFKDGNYVLGLSLFIKGTYKPLEGYPKLAFNNLFSQYKKHPDKI